MIDPKDIAVEAFLQYKRLESAGCAKWWTADEIWRFSERLLEREESYRRRRAANRFWWKRRLVLIRRFWRCL